MSDVYGNVKGGTDQNNIVDISGIDYLVIEGASGLLEDITIVRKDPADVNYDGKVDDADKILIETAAANPPAVDNGVMVFDGNDYVYAGSGFSGRFEHTDNYTFAAWIKPYALTSTQTIVGQDYNYSTIFGINSSGKLFLRRNDTQVTSFRKLEPGKWQHVSVTYNASTRRATFYINGVPEVDYYCYDSNGWNNTYLYIGRNNDGHYFKGEMDEVAAFTTDLPAEEIAYIYDSNDISGISTSENSARAIAWWRFEDDIINEISGSELGDLHGVTWIDIDPAEVNLVPVVSEDLNGDRRVNDEDMLIFRRKLAEASLVTKQTIDGEDYYIEQGLDGKYYIRSSEGDMVSGYSNQVVAINGVSSLIVGDALLENIKIIENRFSDLNNDGKVDAADESIVLNSIAAGVYTTLADLDGDVDVDGEDYFIFKAQYGTTGDISRLIELNGFRYYISERDNNTYMLLPEDGSEVIFSEDLNKLGGKDTIFRAVRGVDYVAVWAQDISGVKLAELQTADLDSDGDLDDFDWTILEAALGSVRKDSTDGRDYSAAYNWSEDEYAGDNLSVQTLASVGDNWLEYDVDILQAGAFNIKLQVKNESSYNDMPYGYVYAFDAYINDMTQKIGTVYVDSDNNTYVEGSLYISDMPVGKHA